MGKWAQCFFTFQKNERGVVKSQEIAGKCVSTWRYLLTFLNSVKKQRVFYLRVRRAARIGQISWGGKGKAARPIFFG